MPLTLGLLLSGGARTRGGRSGSPLVDGDRDAARAATDAPPGDDDDDDDVVEVKDSSRCVVAGQAVALDRGQRRAPAEAS